ncbi:MAG: hypothetical protein LDL50_00085 [Chloroflexi bacterium]|nr:hypothetical protein [Chloroflexota bacterium]MCA2001232.1 hypothetical protein [Chloroflexota bacterium]
MRRKAPILLFLFAILSACSQSMTEVAATQPDNSIATAVVLTGQAIFSTASALAPTATETPIPTETPLPVTPQPTATPTFAPGFTEFAQIRFIAPGPMSSLVSPIRVQALLTAGRSERVRIELLGENGRLLQRSLERVPRVPSGGVYRSFEIPFEIRAVSERGYIRISSKDDYGRVQALNTMPVLLYSIGENQITPIGNMMYERVAYEGIKDGAEARGGTVALKGRIAPFNDQPVFWELITTEGRVISSRLLDFKGVETQSFETTLPYKVTEPTRVRLSLHQDNLDFDNDPELKQYVYLHSIELTLYP